MREPNFAGDFYEDEKNLLEEQITTLFHSGPGDLPLRKSRGELYGAIVPHGRYALSGACSAWAYKELAESVKPELIILVGPSHATGKTAVSAVNWKTPFGTVEVAKDLVDIFVNKGIPVDEETHADYVLESQLPFLQFICKDKMPPVLFLTVGADASYKQIGKLLSLLMESTHVWFIVSTDLTHYGQDYDFVPFIYNIESSVQELDKGLIECVQKMNPNMLLNYATQHKIPVCGLMAIASVLEALKVHCEARLLHYSTSAHVTQDTSTVIGYASLVFE